MQYRTIDFISARLNPLDLLYDSVSTTFLYRYALGKFLDTKTTIFLLKIIFLFLKLSKFKTVIQE